MPTKTQERCRSLFKLGKFKELQSLKNKSSVETNIVRSWWSRRLDWNAWLLQVDCIELLLSSLYKTVSSPINSDISIHKNSIYKWIHNRNMIYDSLNTSDFIILTSYPIFHYWIQYHEFRILTTIFSNDLISWIHCYEIIFMGYEFRFDTMNSKTWNL